MFEGLLATPDDGRRYERLNGEHVEMAPPIANHALLVSTLEWRLGRADVAGYGIGIVGRAVVPGRRCVGNTPLPALPLAASFVAVRGDVERASPMGAAATPNERSRIARGELSETVLRVHRLPIL
jgi:hypothetical protein